MFNRTLNNKSNKNAKLSKLSRKRNSNSNPLSISKPWVNQNITTRIPFEAPRVFPPEITVDLIYNETVLLSAFTTANYVFRGNSVYDTNYSGTGGQPVWFDTLTRIYRNFFVEASEIFIISYSSSQTPLSVAVFPQLDVTYSGTYNELRDQPFSSYCTSTLYNTKCSLYSGVTSRTMFGMDVSNNTNYWCTSSANPTTGWYWFIRALSEAANTTDCYLEVSIKFRVKCFQYVSSYDT